MGEPQVARVPRGAGLLCDENDRGISSLSLYQKKRILSAKTVVMVCFVLWSSGVRLFFTISRLRVRFLANAPDRPGSIPCEGSIPDRPGSIPCECRGRSSRFHGSLMGISGAVGIS